MLQGSMLLVLLRCLRVIDHMTNNALEDFSACLHYSDDWDVMGDDD